MKNSMILAKDQYYSLDSFQTRLNNNVLVVGTSGAGKTRSLVEPNLLQATGSYVVSDPKGNLHNKYKDYLESRGYRVVRLDFTDPAHSAGYNFFRYIRNTQDIVKIAHMFMFQDKALFGSDPFWERSAQLLLQACIAYLLENCSRESQSFESIMKLVSSLEIDENDPNVRSALDYLMDDLAKENKDSYAVKTYKKFRCAAGRTLRSIMISLFAVLGAYDTPELCRLMQEDTVELTTIGDRKTALFVVVSDTDRSLDGLANVFFTQTMNELCHHADKDCPDNRLPLHTRFILDDFATNVCIGEFPRMIASIRSRNLSAMLMIQAESQLQEAYGHDGRTIIGNCDTYVYLGGNDVDTAKAVAERCDVPAKNILDMPVGRCWIFRRGQNPMQGEQFDLTAYREIFRQEQETVI